MALDKDEMMTRIIAIAEELISQGGSENLKARTIAAKAGIAVGSIYNMFGDLNDLHRIVNVRLLNRLTEVLAAEMRQAAIVGVTDMRLRLLTLARAYLEFVKANSRNWAAMLAFNRETTLEGQDEYRRRFDAMFDIITTVLEQGHAPLTPQERVVSAHVLWSSVHGIVTSGYTRGEENDDPLWRQIDVLVTTFLAGMAALHPQKQH